MDLLAIFFNVVYILFERVFIKIIRIWRFISILKFMSIFGNPLLWHYLEDLANESELVAILSIDGHLYFVWVRTDFDVKSLVFAIADETSKQNFWMELRIKASIFFNVGVKNLDFPLFLNINGVASSVARSFDGFIIDFLVPLRHISFLGVVAIIVEHLANGLLSFLEFFLDFLQSCHFALHPRMGFNLVNCESLLVVIFDHGGDEVEKVFWDWRKFQTVLLCNDCPVLLILLLLNVLVKIVFWLCFLLSWHIS